jgi:hypothetical protein
MLEHSGHFDWLFKAVEHAKDSFATFALYGATQQTQINTSAIATSIVVGVLSAMAATYLQSDRTANDLKREAAASSEFRQEVREYMRNQGDKLAAVSDKTARLEVQIAAMNGAMQGMGGNRGQRGMSNDR